MRFASIVRPLLVSTSLLGASASALAQQRTGDLSVSGTLARGDSQDDGGRYLETRTLQLRAGEGVSISLDSSEFDTVVRVTGPDFSAENDDSDGNGTNSRLAFQAITAGDYQITVTSYGPKETGAYALVVHRETGAPVPPPTNAGDPPRLDPRAPGDPPNAGGGDPVLGQSWVWDERQHRFVPAGTANDPGDGPPRGQTQPPGDNPFVPDGAPGDGSGTVYGVFVGVSNYGGGNDLDDTANDARNLAAAFEHTGMIHRGNAIVLTDDDATTGRVRQAFQTLSQRVTAHDTFVFFFDGHGDVNEVELQSSPLTGRELSSLLQDIRGEQVVILDSCYSGSIASVMRGNPRRIGLFSSRSTETSFVASEVHAGGWLAYFMIQAVTTRLAGRDGSLNLRDLVAYLQRGYSRRVGSHQHLVVASAARSATLWRVPGRSNTVALAR